MNVKQKRYFIIVLLISFVIMLYIFSNDYNELKIMFSKLNYLWFFVALFFMFIYCLLDSLFVFVYCRKIVSNYSLWMGIKVQQVGMFFSAITPFSSGGQLAQIFILRKQKVNSKASVSMLMMSFISYQSMLILLSFIYLLFEFRNIVESHASYAILIILGFIVNTSVIVVLLLASFSKNFHNFIIDKFFPLLHRIKLVKNLDKTSNSAEEWLVVFRNEFIHLVNDKKLMLMRLTIDFLRLNVIYSIPYICLLAFDIIDHSFSIYITTLTLACFVQIITAFIPSPGAILGVEIIFGGLFGNFVNIGQISSLMLLWRFITYYVTMFSGFIIFTLSKELRNTKEELS